MPEAAAEAQSDATKNELDAMELTVIVPARNEEDCLGACLESLVAQSNEFFALGRDWELLVVDDGSTDSRHRCEFFRRDCPRPGKARKRLDRQG